MVDRAPRPGAAPLGREPVGPAAAARHRRLRPGADAVEMADDPAAAARVDARLGRGRRHRSHALVVIHVSAGNAFRRWPAAAFEDLVAGLVRARRNRRVVLTSGPSDADAAAPDCDAARARLGDEPPVDARSAGTSISPSCERSSARASVYIGGDSGPLHVAATTRTPIVALLGPTLPERSRPWRDPRWFAEIVELALPCRPCHQRACEPGDFRCLTWINAGARARSRRACHGGRRACERAADGR